MSVIPRVARTHHRWMIGVGTALALLGGLAVAGPATSASAKSNGTLILYSAQHAQTTDALVAAFEHETGIKVKVEADDEDVLTAQIEQEGSRSPADVFYTENSNWLQQLDDRGMLAPVNSSTLANVPKQDSATNGDWLGVSARIAVLVYDPAKVPASQVPRHILQLASPKWKGKIEIAPSETDFWPVIDSVQRAYGTKRTLAWLKGLKRNAGVNDNVPDNETLTSDVSSGGTDLALINHYYYYRQRAAVGANGMTAKLAYFAPKDPGYVEAVSGAAILKSSKHKRAAQEFLQFITSEAGQTVIAHSESFEYPLNPHVAANPQLKPLKDLHPTNFTPAELGEGLEAKKLLQEVGLI